MALIGKKVLIIDDDISFHNIVSKILNAQGIITHSTTELSTAGTDISTFYPDLIILDLNFGTELKGQLYLKELKANPTLSKIPVIICSAFSTEEIVKKCIIYGANDYLTKPIKQTWLIQRIRLALGRSQTLRKIFEDSTHVAQLSIEGQLTGIGETHCIVESQLKIKNQVKVNVQSSLLEQHQIRFHSIKSVDDGQSKTNGLYKSTFVILGVSEKETDKIRKMTVSWRSK
jgi:two-component system, chemotaxis family, response regulator PixH